jgi:prevent-host-death family protein
MVMKSVGVAELKGNLSKHLRAVRRGHPLTVLDRDTPVAQIIPYPEGEAALPVRRPAEGAGKPGQLRWPPPLRLHHDPVSLLLEDRQER